MKAKLFLTVLMVLITSFTSTILGENYKYSQKYDVKDFNSIVMNSVLDVTFIQGDSYSIQAFCDKDILKNLKVEKKNKTLRLENKEKMDDSETIHLTITAPQLEGIDLSGVCKFTCDKLNSKEAVTLRLSGIGKITLGQVDCSSLQCYISGVGKVEGAFTVQNDAVFHTSGSSKTQVRIDAKTISLHVSGVAKADVIVNCKELEAHNSGVGKLNISGFADKTNIHNSGVSHINTKDLNSF